MPTRFRPLASVAAALDRFQVSQLDRVLMAKHLATLIRSGIPIDESLEILAEEASSGRLRRVIRAVRGRIEGGATLSESLATYPSIFNPLFVQMVRVGEESGTLEENLRYVADQLEHEYDLKQKVKGAAAYPVLVLVLAFVMGGAMSFFILPRLVPLFESLNVELPLPTRIVLAMSVFFVRFGGVFFVGVIVGLILLRFLLRSTPVRPYWHRFLVRVPVIGRIVMDINLARLTRTLGILLRSGLPIVEALAITLETTGNEVYATLIRKSGLDVERGLPLSEGMLAASKDTKVLPIIVPRMIGVGERTGTLDDSLINLAEFYEKEVDGATKTMSTVVEPLLIIVIGLVVGLIAIAIISPIYQLTGEVRPTGAGG